MFLSSGVVKSLLGVFKLRRRVDVVFHEHFVLIILSVLERVLWQIQLAVIVEHSLHHEQLLLCLRVALRHLVFLMVLRKLHLLLIERRIEKGSAVLSIIAPRSWLICLKVMVLGLLVSHVVDIQVDLQDLLVRLRHIFVE